MFAVEEWVSDVATAAVGDVKAAFLRLIPMLQNPNSEAGKKTGSRKDLYVTDWIK